MMYKKGRMWQRMSAEDIRKKIDTALRENRNYDSRIIMGAPVSQVSKVLTEQLDLNNFILRAWQENSNHIGCHTFGDSIPFFAGTQKLEKEVIDICAKDIFKGKEDFDGYITSGGTESVITAIWAYRNLFIKQYNAKLEQISIICSSDTHYAVYKASNLLSIDVHTVAVNEETRVMDVAVFESSINDLQESGKHYFIVICNMMTTFFGTTDEVDSYAKVLKEKCLEYKIHIDAAFGGFFYPFSNPDSDINFLNPNISSITLDPHKFLQAPLGSGILIARKNIIQQLTSSKSTYIKGLDSTFSGSRSGFQALMIWIILMAYGRAGWEAYVAQQMSLANWFEQQLQKGKHPYFRDPFSNIFAIAADCISLNDAFHLGLVPDNHQQPKWYKVILMPHVNKEALLDLIASMSLSNKNLK